MTRDGLVFGLFAIIPLTAIYSAASAMTKRLKVTITIFYQDGTSETFTNCGTPTIDGGMLTFTGTSANGVTGTWSINVDIIKKYVQA